MKRFVTVSLCLLALTLSGLAQTKKSTMKKAATGSSTARSSIRRRPTWYGRLTNRKSTFCTAVARLDFPRFSLAA